MTSPALMLIFTGLLIQAASYLFNQKATQLGGLFYWRRPSKAVYRYGAMSMALWITGFFTAGLGWIQLTADWMG